MATEVLMSYEVDVLTGNVNIKKRRYEVGVDEFGQEITKPVDWRCVVICGNEEELVKHLDSTQIAAAKSSWTDEKIAAATARHDEGGVKEEVEDE